MSKDASFHESYQRPADVVLGSERSFGFVFAASALLHGNRHRYLGQPKNCFRSIYKNRFELD